MLYYLRKTRKAICGKATVALITRILAVTIETGLMCAVTVTFSLVVFVFSSRNSVWYMVSAIPVSKLYSNSLLAVCAFQTLFKLFANAERRCLMRVFVS